MLVSVIFTREFDASISLPFKGRAGVGMG